MFFNIIGFWILGVAFGWVLCFKVRAHDALQVWGSAPVARDLVWPGVCMGCIIRVRSRVTHSPFTPTSRVSDLFHLFTCRR